MTKRRYWEEYSVGEEITTGAITIGEAHIFQFAGLSTDFHPLHVNEEYAKGTQFGKRIAHGPMIFGMSVGLITSSGIWGDAAIALLGFDNIRIPAPVFIGDTIHVKVKFKEKRESRKPDRGIMTSECECRNQRDEVVMAFDQIQLFHRQGVSNA